MDAKYFLTARTTFIRFCYTEGIRPFREIQQRIALGQHPFDNPPYSEDPEPAFMEQWSDAETAVDVLGLSCVSLLSDTLKLYFQTLQERVIGFHFTEDEKAIANKHGFVAAYKAALANILDTDWADCPARFDIIEQVVLARNRGQHGEDLTSFRVSHERKSLRKHPKPFFASEAELQTWEAFGGNENSLFRPTIEITGEKLFSAIQEIEELAAWIDGRMDKAWKWRLNAMPD
jgi:hypothetical protein